MFEQGLFSPKEFRNPAADEKWTKREVDRLLDAYLAGGDLGRIAVSLGRNRKAIVRKLQEYIYNERDRVTNYQPRQRTSRKGKRLTKNEHQLIHICQGKGISDKLIANVLARDPSEITPPVQAAHNLEQMKKAAVGVDLILAYRLLYYGHGISIVSDRDYDALEKEEIEFGGGKGILDKFVGSDCKEDYPPHIRALALYLAFKYTERQKATLK